MAVIRVSKTKGFSVMSNYHLRDKNLSLKAKGLLSMMLSLPDGWHYTIRGLASICKEGVESISSGIRELEKCGYVRRHQPNIDGKFQEIEYVIYEMPQDQTASISENNTSGSGEPDHENPSPIPQQQPVGPRSSVSAVSLCQPDTEIAAPSSADTEIAAPSSADTEIAYTETPDTENPYTGNPYTERPLSESPSPENLNAIYNTEKSNTEREKTEYINHPSINQEVMDRSEKDLLSQLDARKATGEYETYCAIIKEHISFDILCLDHPGEREMLEGIVELLAETICSKSAYVHIAGQELPREIVRSRFLKLDKSHIEYILTSFAKNTVKVRNMKAYLLASLYNAPVTISPYYQNWVLSDNPQYAAK